MEFLFDNIGMILFIGFIIMSAVFNSVGSIIKKAAEAADKSKSYQSAPHKFNPNDGESAEDFFNKMQEKQTKPAKKLKLSSKPKINETDLPSEKKKEDAYKFEAPDRDNVESIPTTTKKFNNAINRINRKDKDAIRKAIIINEVLGRPKAYEL